MTHPTDTPLPRPLQVAHWLYEQQRPVSSREAAELLGGSTWSMWQTFSKMRLLSDILIIDEQLVPARGGQQSLMRILHIYPYILDEHQQPHRQRTDAEQHDVPLTWRDLLCRSWAQLAQMYQSRIDRDN
ncbi:hypothetical protein JFQ93_001456 [Aeromonas sobria]|nr:hypothetical protein [Aeromonas sobria]